VIIETNARILQEVTSGASDWDDVADILGRYRDHYNALPHFVRESLNARIKDLMTNPEVPEQGRRLIQEVSAAQDRADIRRALEDHSELLASAPPRVRERIFEIVQDTVIELIEED